MHDIPRSAFVSRVPFGPTAIAYAAFVPTGMVTVLLGPLLPSLAARWSLSDTQSGYLVTAQFLGALLATLSSSILLPRLGFRWSIAIGQCLMALGVATLISSTFAGALLSVFCYGMGIGLTIPTGNLMVAESTPGRRSSALNLLNFSWSAGAVACPFLIAAAQRVEETRLLLRGIAGFLLLLTAVSLLLELTGASQQKPGNAEKSHVKHFHNSAAIILGALFFLYVGTENSLGTWLASYAKRGTVGPGSEWITIPSYFYAALLLGRVLAPFSLEHLNDTAQARCGILLAVAGCGTLLVWRSVLAIAVGAFLAGLGLSTLYPIAIGFLSSRFGANASRIGGMMFALSALGGASVPWLVGFTSTQSGSLRIALLIPLAGLLIMLLLFSSSRIREHAVT